jgi:hypothetical protein
MVMSRRLANVNQLIANSINLIGHDSLLD